MTSDSKKEDNIRDKYISYLDSFKNIDPGRCPSPALLLDFQENKLSGKMKRKIEDHVVECPLCLEALEALSSGGKGRLPADWSGIEKDMDAKFYSELKNTVVEKLPTEQTGRTKFDWNILKSKGRTLLDTIFHSKTLVYVPAVAALTLLFIYSYAYLSRDRYFGLATIKPEKQILLRSADFAASAFTEGLGQLGEGEYDKAIDNFSLYLHTYPDHYASQYYIGLCHLYKAEKKLFGVGYKFDNTETEKGIENLTAALRLCNDNKYYQADCRWYLGKAYIMKDDIDNAKRQFLSIIELSLPNSARKEAANKILDELKSMK
jgi:tetratricopeptide (TPR) repeat protein